MENLSKMEDQIIYLNDSRSLYARVLVRNENMVTFELRERNCALDIDIHPLLLQDAIAKFREIYPYQGPKCLLYQHTSYVIYLYGRTF